MEYENRETTIKESTLVGIKQKSENLRTQKEFLFFPYTFKKPTAEFTEKGDCCIYNITKAYIHIKNDNRH